MSTSIVFLVPVSFRTHYLTTEATDETARSNLDTLYERNDLEQLYHYLSLTSGMDEKNMFDIWTSVRTSFLSPIPGTEMLQTQVDRIAKMNGTFT